MGEKLHNDLQAGLTDITTQLSKLVKQLLPQVEGPSTEQKGSEVSNVESATKSQPSVAASLGLGTCQMVDNIGKTLQETLTLPPILDPFKINSRRSKLECPRFDGYDFLGWQMKVEQYFEAVEIPETEKVQMVMIHLDGKALQWHQRYMKAKGPLKEMQWSTYAVDMRARFNDNEFTDPMSELVSLRQTNSVEEYYEEFEALLNLLQLSDDYSLSIFISNLKSDLSKSVRLFHPTTLTQALNLAKQMEALMHGVPKKPLHHIEPLCPLHLHTLLHNIHLNSIPILDPINYQACFLLPKHHWSFTIHILDLLLLVSLNQLIPDLILMTLNLQEPLLERKGTKGERRVYACGVVRNLFRVMHVFVLNSIIFCLKTMIKWKGNLRSS